MVVAVGRRHRRLRRGDDPAPRARGAGVVLDRPRRERRDGDRRLRRDVRAVDLPRRGPHARADRRDADRQLDEVGHRRRRAAGRGACGAACGGRGAARARAAVERRVAADRAQRAALGAVAADREHEGARDRLPARRDDRPDPRRRRSGRCRARAARADVPDPRRGRGDDRHHGARCGPAAVHERPPARRAAALAAQPADGVSGRSGPSRRTCAPGRRAGRWRRRRAGCRGCARRPGSSPRPSARRRTRRRGRCGSRSGPSPS